MSVRKVSHWYWLPSFYRYKEITNVRTWDIHWLCFVLTPKEGEKYD